MTADADAPLARRARLRSWWVDGLEAAPYLLASVAVSLLIADGGLLTVTNADYVYTLGRALGLVAAVLMLTQVTLAARVPVVERALGHDRAMAAHTRLGKIAIIAMALHAAVILLVSAHYADVAWWREGVDLFTSQWYLAWAQIALGLFAVVFATSLVIVRRRWRYETWHAVHLLTYAAIAAAVPHQFLEGSTFRDGGASWWFWLALYAVAFGSLAWYRLVRPLVRLRTHRLEVTAVEPAGDGHTSVRVGGPGAARLGATAGQFLLWRFLDARRWRSAHPFTLSAIDADGLRLTAKAVGDGTRALADLAVGTRVLVEGPFGVFTRDSRTRAGAVLVCAGIGITPVRAMLAQWGEEDGPVDVIARVRSRREAPLLAEVEELAAVAGASVTVIEGSRDGGWGGSLAGIVPDVAARDVYVCGPPAWARLVEDDARASSVARDALHRETFGWHREVR